MSDLNAWKLTICGVLRKMKACVLVFLSVCPVALKAIDLQSCVDIIDSALRLSCYDDLAAKARSLGETPQLMAVGEDSVTRDEISHVKPAKEFGYASADDNPRNQNNFGKDSSVNLNEIDRVLSRIESVERNSLGKQIITLTNGQRWIENELGSRTIDLDQLVTIRKKRRHYQLELNNAPNVTVRRID
jgi:hypothetical protein